MQQGFAVWQANGQELGKPFWLALLGEGYARAGQVEEGLRVLAEASAMAQTRGLRVWEAELNRLQGELWLQRATRRRTHPRQKPVLRQALEIAHRDSKRNHWSCGRP